MVYQIVYYIIIVPIYNWVVYNPPFVIQPTRFFFIAPLAHGTNISHQAGKFGKSSNSKVPAGKRICQFPGG